MIPPAYFEDEFPSIWAMTSYLEEKPGSFQRDDCFRGIDKLLVSMIYRQIELSQVRLCSFTNAQLLSENNTVSEFPLNSGLFGKGLLQEIMSR